MTILYYVAFNIHDMTMIMIVLGCAMTVLRLWWTTSTTRTVRYIVQVEWFDIYEGK